MTDKNLKGLIFDIQGYSVHDGSGCRTLVFLSGCPLRCRWCSNPEGQLLRQRLLHRESKCVHKYYRCVDACPHDAIRMMDGESPPVEFDRSFCDSCDTMDCSSACLNEALRISGRYYTVDELMRILLRDQGFWGSNGGVTFGGGEPLLQAEFLLAALKKCQESYMHTALETCAHAPTETLLEALNFTEMLFIDLKHIDPDAHLAGTGVTNNLILENIRAVASSVWNGRLIIRVTIVPGYNDTMENLSQTAEFISKAKLKEVNLLPFHRLGQSKYQQLGLEYEFANASPPSGDEMSKYQGIFENAGLKCYVGYDIPF
ncbi:glycyl-radical enzyme activating protein [bacterium]|nr:glycyl-radical enzyme activating protein [bacterium]